jgi:DNA polymerase-3 subunit delta'
MQFSEVIGQADVKKRLVQTVSENRISHAQLFVGQEGSGNLALAIAFAQFVLCTDRNETDSCGKCPSCTKLVKLEHPDLHFVYPVASGSITKPVSDDFIKEWRETILENAYINATQWYEAISIENKQGQIGERESQEILRKLSLKSYESDYKVMIIWMPEKMNLTASNKLLKLIEEPPEKTIFLLVTEDSGNILQTILSRTQIIKIPKIENIDLKAYLQSSLELSENEIDGVVRIANGNYLEAKNLLNESESREYNFNKFVEIMRLCYSRKLIEIFAWVDEVSSLGREKQKNFFSYALRMIRENFMLNLKVNDIVRLSDKECNWAEKFCPFINQNNAFQIAAEVTQAQADIERNAYGKITLLDMALKIVKLIR